MRVHKSVYVGVYEDLYENVSNVYIVQYRFNATSHSQMLHMQVHNPLLVRESTSTSRLGNRVKTYSHKLHSE